MPSGIATFFGVCVALLGATPPVRAANPVAIASEGADSKTACDGAAAKVAGGRNTVILTGSCARLTVRGDGNTVMIELAPGASIDIEGSGNRLRFTVPGGAGPAVRLVGDANDVSGTGAGQSAGPIQLTGDNQVIALGCGDQAVTIAGNRSRYELRGGCASVVAHGDGNRVRATLRAGATVEVEGNGTTVGYDVAGGGAPPVAVVRGRDSFLNRAGRDLVAVPAPVAALSLMNQPAVASQLAQTVHDLDAKIVLAGTSVTWPASALFEGGSDVVRDPGDARFVRLASLVAQTHPSAVVVTASDPADPVLALHRAQAVAAQITASAQVSASAQAGDAAGTKDAVMEILLRR